MTTSPTHDTSDYAANPVADSPPGVILPLPQPPDERLFLPAHSLREVRHHRKAPEWLIEGFWLHGQHGNIAGAEKTLKSHTADAVALSVASGMALFGKFTVPKARRVVIFSGERDKAMVLDNLVHFGRAYGLSEDDVLDLPITIIDRVALAESPQFQGTLARELEEGTGLVIVDSLYNYHGAHREAGNVHQSSMVRTAMSYKTQAAGASLIIVEHFTKGAEKNLSLNSITQAGAREWAAAWVLLRHREEPDVTQHIYCLEMKVGGRRWGGDSWEVDWSLGPINRDSLQYEGVPSWTVRPASAANTAPLARSRKPGLPNKQKVMQ